MSIICIVQLFKLIKERKSITASRIIKIVSYISLIFLNSNYWILHECIESVDTFIFLDQKKEIVEKIKRGEITLNLNDNKNRTDLPKGYPQVSNPDNSIEFYGNETNDTTTVIFYIFSNFMESPSIMLIYTNDKESIRKLEEEIVKYPEENWKVEENWYRYVGDYFY